MNANLKKFSVVPSVVEADKESEIIVRSLDGTFRFYDDITYEVKFIPADESDIPMDWEISLTGYEKARKVYQVKPIDGELRLKYFFSGEQEWRIHISCREYEKYQNPLYRKYVPHWNPLIEAPAAGINLAVYSLNEDLYCRRALAGDLHVHTIASDGSESAGLVAAGYRKAGKDFIAVTDHNVFRCSEEAQETFSFMENFRILHGEEVHNGYIGFFHMVNIGGDYSVNEIYLNEPERVEREVEELKGNVDVPEGVDEREYLHRYWLYREIKKSGGYGIFAHPFWFIGHRHTSTAMSKAIVKNGLCDAMEVLGGCTPKGNNQQLALYHDLLAEGYRVPVVGVNDSHTVLAGEHLKHSTVVFAENGGITEAISKGYSVAAESLPGESVRVYGSLRLVYYTHFLLENYFPVHQELCSVSGIFMEEYLHGNSEAKERILAAEKRVKDHETAFFGR